MRLCNLSIVALCSCLLLGLRAESSSAGTWSIQATMTAGTATTSTTPASANMHIFTASQVYTLPATPPFLALKTSVPVPSGSRSNTATADGVNVHFVLTWVPDAGKTMLTDPPPATINVAASLD